MIDQSAPRSPSALSPPPNSVAETESERPARLPVSAGLGRFLVLFAVLLCAACGLVYELALLALASNLLGDTVTQASIVVSVMVFAMGLGSLLAKRLRVRAAVGFGAVEAALALVGGCSAMALYASFAWLGSCRPALVVFAVTIGVLTGAEIPLLMTLIQRVRRQDAGGAVADLFAADYVGALVGGIAFPFLLLPALGQLTGVLLTGVVNAVAGGALVLWLFRRDLTMRARWSLGVANAVVLALLVCCAVLTGPFERAAREVVYGPEVRVAEQTEAHEIVLTGAAPGASGSEPLALYLDGELQVNARNEARYHEALVHPAMAGRHRRVVILGGGDGLALREVLRYPDVSSVTVVDLDGEVLRLGREDPGLAELNHRAFRDRRVRVVRADAFDWLRSWKPEPARRPAPGSGPNGAVSFRADIPNRPGAPAAEWDRRTSRPAERLSHPADRSAGRGAFDVVVSDLPGPSDANNAKLYSLEFYGLIERLLAPGGRLAVHAGQPGTGVRDYWTVNATLRAAGLRTAPYRIGGRADGPTSGTGTAAGDWGFVLAGRSRVTPRLPARHPELPELTAKTLSTAWRDTRQQRVSVHPSTLMRPRYGG